MQRVGLHDLHPRPAGRIGEGHLGVGGEEPVIARADRYVGDRISQCARLGELHHAIAAGVVAAECDWPELGAVIAGIAGGRSAPADITVCDLTGTGVQDTAIATLAYVRCAAAGAGTEFES